MVYTNGNYVKCTIATQNKVLISDLDTVEFCKSNTFPEQFIETKSPIQIIWRNMSMTTPKEQEKLPVVSTGYTGWTPHARNLRQVAIHFQSMQTEKG